MKISLVIPTRNRSEFLRYCVATCLACDDDNIEIIVSDNNSLDDTRRVIEAIVDPRLKYVNTGQDVSMRQNFEFALEHATGDYLIYIGDDDGILPNGLVTLRRMIDRYQPDVILWRHITYDWPRADGSAPGRLKFRCRDFCGPMKFIDPEQVFHGFCQAKHINYRGGANIYHGCVHRRVIDKVRGRQNGTYFNDISPDINTALTNLTASRSILWFRNPVTIAGAGEKSTGYAFTPRSSISSVQKDVTKDYSSLIIEDQVVSNKLGVRIRSIPAHTYVNLCQINFAAGGPGLAINHEAWRRIIIIDIKTFKPELRRWDALESFFQEVDQAYQPKGLAEEDPEAINPSTIEPTTPQPIRRKPAKKGHVSADALRNVESVMQWLQAVTGRPYTPPANPALAVIKQAYRSVGMQLRVISIQKKGRG